jgi:Helix-turn-helix domain
MTQPAQWCLLKTKDVARVLACSPWQVRELVHAGRIKPVIFNPDAADWRFDSRELERFVDSCRGIND